MLKLPQSDKFDLLATHPCRHYSGGRNPSYPASLVNGLTAGLWWLPATIMLILRHVLLPIALGVLWAFLIVVMILAYHVFWLIAGVCGFLRDDRVQIVSRLEP